MIFDPSDPSSLEEKFQKKITGLRVKNEEERAKNLAKQLNFPYLNLFFTPIDPEALSLLEESRSREAGLAIIQRSDKTIRIVTKDPTNALLREVVEGFESRGNKPSIVVVSDRSLEKAYSFYKKSSTKNKITGSTDVDTEKFAEYNEKIKKIIDVDPYLKTASLEGTAAVLGFVLGAALALDVSDVHLESEVENGRLRYRMDGLLYTAGLIDKRVLKSLLLRLKLISRLKINVTEEPQDGRFSVKINDIEIEIRTSVLPGPNGENVVLRILHPKAISVTLDKIGFQKWDLDIINYEIEKPNGMIMVTGPTGSGKTTTLYAIMRKLNSQEAKIITLEDPVEYHVTGLEQVQIDANRGLTFATGLRSILRQDPDIILVGELRDHDTTETAIHAALTGHLVLTTMHTNDSAGTIPRLIDVGVSPAIIAPAVNLSMAQRLIRKMCLSCGIRSKALPEELEIIKSELTNLSPRVNRNILPAIDENLEIARPQGCEKCNNTGYKGRIAVFELFVLDAEVKEFILTNPSHTQLQEMAARKGTVTMRQDGFIKVLSGITDIEEIFRILGKTGI